MRQKVDIIHGLLLLILGVATIATAVTQMKPCEEEPVGE